MLVSGLSLYVYRWDHEGYLNRPEEENIRFLKIPSRGLERVFRTGDFGRLDNGVARLATGK